MKKTLFTLFLISIFFFGVLVGGPTGQSAADKIQKEIDQFERDITTPGNNYEPKREEKIDPNITNSIAKKGEKAIEGLFDYSFKFIERLVR